MEDFSKDKIKGLGHGRYLDIATKQHNIEKQYKIKFYLKRGGVYEIKEEASEGFKDNY